jgi:hypothetical protein
MGTASSMFSSELSAFRADVEVIVAVCPVERAIGCFCGRMV